MRDIFEKLIANQGPIGQHRDRAHGYFAFPKLEGEIGSRMKFRGKDMIVWSLNNYLGLANDPVIREVDAEASKNYGLAAAALLEAEIVIADGSVKIVNAQRKPDLFWAIKGGGGGSFGVVTKLTLKTRELPENFGAMFGKIKANSDEAYLELIKKIIILYSWVLCSRKI